MAYPVGGNGLSTLRASSHWHADLFQVSKRNGGTPLRFSTLQRRFTYQGQVYVPTAGEKFDAEEFAGMAAGDTELVGSLSPSTIGLVDIQRGIYDDARIDQYVVDWRRPDKTPYQHFVWYVDDIQHNGRSWKAILSSSARFLQVTRGESYSFACPAVLGDDRCRATVTSYAGTITAIVDDQLEFESSVVAATGLFRLGQITWLTGNNRGTVCRVLASNSTDGAFALAIPTRFRMRVGDTFEARPGCDGLATTCKNTHANLANFQGNERQRNSKQLIVARGQVN